MRVSVENLRGYYSTTLRLDRPRTILVGPNNSGKTSVLRLISWVLNDLTDDLVDQKRSLSADEQQLLLPARDARHRARRLTLRVFVEDARSWSKFGCTREGFVDFRLNVRLTPTPLLYLALGDPSRRETPTTDPNALELLRRLREAVTFVHIPSFRDAKSHRFNSSLQEALRSRIEARALHAQAAGAPREYRTVARSLDAVKKTMLQLAAPLWDEVRDRLPPGLAKDAVLELMCDHASFLGFLESNLRLRISTGDHDALAVPVDELGSGLQSVLDLAFQDTQTTSGNADLILAAEEPEAFLHPAAQRTIATQLLGRHDPGRRVILTTHSPVVVAEARYGDVVLCREHKFYEPAEVAQGAREEINTALLGGFGAEMIFGSSVLLVEGEGDRQFFENLRRRIARHDRSGVLDNCFVVPVGSKARFGPWIQLLTSYGDAGDRPIRFLVAADGDASSDVRSGFRDAKVSVKQEVLDAMGMISAEMNAQNLSKWRSAVDRHNELSLQHDVPTFFLKLDLEEAMLTDARSGLLDEICQRMNWEDEPDRPEVMRRLGAKGFGGANGRKDVHIRGLIGERIHPADLTPNVRRCLARWFALASSDARAEQLIKGWRSSDGAT